MQFTARHRLLRFGCPSCRTLFQINQQHGDIGGADAGDSPRLPDRHGADPAELLPGFQPQSRNGVVVDIRGQQPGLFLLEIRNLLFLPGQIARVLDLNFHFLRDGGGKRRPFRVKGSQIGIADLGPAQQVGKSGRTGNRRGIPGGEHLIQRVRRRNTAGLQPADFPFHGRILCLHRRQPLRGHQTHLRADGGQPLVGVVLPVEQPVFRAAGHNPVGLLRSLGHQIIDEGADVAGVPGEDKGFPALKLLGRPPLILTRDTSYIGTLIDDLVTKGTEEPYRIMTSRSEYRLLHRQDNADQRLTRLGAEIGLVSRERLAQVEEKYELVRREIARLEGSGVPGSEALNTMLALHDTAPVANSARLADLLRRPQISYADIAPFDADRPELPAAVTQEVEIQIKYAGYLERQQRQVAEFKKEESRLLPANIRYADIPGLRLEAREKLDAIRPMSIGQAGRISGVSPADIAVLLIYLEQQK